MLNPLNDVIIQLPIYESSPHNEFFEFVFKKPGQHGIIAFKLVEGEEVPLEAVIDWRVSFEIDSKPEGNFWNENINIGTATNHRE